MSYSSAAGPWLAVQTVAGGLISSSTSVTPGFGNIYMWRTTDASSVWDASNYVTDAAARGMRKYDLVFVLNTGSTIIGLAMVTSISTSTATLGYGTMGVVGLSTA